MDKHLSIDTWIAELTAYAQSSELANAIRSVFASNDKSNGLHAALRDLASLANNDTTFLPTIRIVDDSVLEKAPGAYSSELDTIFISSEILKYQTLATEVLTHELGHAIASRYFGENTSSGSAYDFTHALLGQDHALILSSGAVHRPHESEVDHSIGQQASAFLTLPDFDKPIAIERFDTALHIDWARAQLPMLNADAFEIFKLGQNDSDAFIGTTRIGVLSPYGLQTDSNTHFDNNNIRGSIETMSKRWSDALDHFGSNTSTPSLPSIIWNTKTLVAPSFDGNGAGVELMMYRFGQITHALQDFYSHSNWIESVRSGKIKTGALLDSGLDLPTPSNPGEILKSAPKVMVAMSGPNYSAILERAGVGSYDLGLGIKNVYWWVNNKETNPNEWGTAFAKLKVSSLLVPINGLMTGAVNGAIYYDTDYSALLRAVDSTGFFAKEYFRGFSHGGAAGTVAGQWISPLAKDKDNNGRFSSKSENKKLFEFAEEYAGLQLRNEFDRMGNLIYKEFGIAGLQRFAGYALTVSDAEKFISTYQTPGGRWDWSAVDNSLAAAQLFIGEQAAEEEAFYFDDSNIRFVEVFYDKPDTGFTSLENREYFTQVLIDEQWFDASERLINTHHDHLHDYGPEAFLPAETQHVSFGGRMVYSEHKGYETHYLSTIYSVANYNLQARVYINNFDVGLDMIHVVDAQGNLIETIDPDRANYADTRQYLLETYNIAINARAEIMMLKQSFVIHSDQVNGTLILNASQFFADPDNLLDSNRATASGINRDIRFIDHDETRSWVSLLENGTLQISDISQASQGRHDIYVAVSDQASLLEGAMISLIVDPEVSVAGLAYSPESWLELNFRNESESAVSIFGLVVNEEGIPVSTLEHIGTSVGNASGLPDGVDAQKVFSNLADPWDHGEIGFFAKYFGSQEIVALDVIQTGENQFALSNGNEAVADLTIRQKHEVNSPIYIDELFVQGVGDVLLGLPLNLDHQSSSTSTTANHQITIQAVSARESDYEGEFGFFLADLQSGHLVDPSTGNLLEDVGLNPDNVSQYSVFAMSGISNADQPINSSFSLNGQLNLDNLALFPYYQVDTHQGNQLFLAGEIGQRDGFSHIARVANNTFGVEDLVGYDYDYDDYMVTIISMSIDYYI